MSNEESGQSRPGQQPGQSGHQPWGPPQGAQGQGAQGQGGHGGTPGQGGQGGTPGQGGQPLPPTSTWPTQPGGTAPHGSGQQGPGPSQRGPGQAPPRPPVEGERTGWGQQPAYGQGQPGQQPQQGQTGPQHIQQGQPGHPGQHGQQDQPGAFGAPSAAATGGSTPKASTGTDSGTAVRIGLHALALLLVVLGISIPMDDAGTLWGDSAAWAAFAVVAALAQGAAFLGRPALGGNGWIIGAAGAAGLLLFWTLLMLPMIQTNMAFMVTVGTACAAVAVALSPDRRL